MLQSAIAISWPPAPSLPAQATEPAKKVDFANYLLSLPSAGADWVAGLFVYINYSRELQTAVAPAGS